jgi:hypothetical protein
MKILIFKMKFKKLKQRNYTKLHLLKIKNKMNNLQKNTQLKLIKLILIMKNYQIFSKITYNYKVKVSKS